MAEFDEAAEGRAQGADSARPRSAAAPPCNLSPAELHRRIAEIRREILPLVRRSEVLPGGRAFEFDASPGTRDRLERLVALERQCCPGVAFRLGPSPSSERLRLCVEGIDPEAGLWGALAVPGPPARGAG